MSKILEVKDLHYRYGEIEALKGISFAVEEGEVVTLLGSNGAGKSTTLAAIAGLYNGISGGEIVYGGEQIGGKPSHKIAGKGISLCFEGRRIFPQLSVKENLLMGAYLRKDYLSELDYVYELFPKLKERSKQEGGTLSGGEQQMLAVGRALMQKPKLLMLDEPSLGLAPVIVEDIFAAINKIHSDGVTILLVEQNCSAALKVADRGYVLETGEIILSGSSEELMNNDLIKRSYMGMD